MSRRHEDTRLKTSVVPTRDRRDDMDQETYFAPRRGGPVRSRRSLSPQEIVERSRRSMNLDRRSSSLERREYEQHIDRVRCGSGSGGGQMLSRSPPVQHPQKRLHLDERAFGTSPTAMRIHGKSEYPEYVEYSNLNTRPRHVYNYDDHMDVVKQKEYSARRLCTSGHHSMAETLPFEEAMDRDVGLRPNYVFASRYAEPCGNYSTTDMHRVKDENAQYQDAISHEKIAKDIYYKDGEQSAYYSRESPYIDSPLSQIKDFGSEDLLKNIPSTSSSIMTRGEYLSKVHDVRTLPPDGYPKRYGKELEPLVVDDYGQRIMSDSRRGYETICRDPKCYACDAYKSSRPERKDYEYPEIRVRGDDEIGYASQENLYTKAQYTREVHDHRDVLRPDRMDSLVESIPKGEGSHSSRRIVKNVGGRDFDVIQKETVLDYVDTRRSSNGLIQAGEYLDSGNSHVEPTRKASNHRHISDLGDLHEHEFEDPHMDYGYGRYAQIGSDRTMLKNSSEYIKVELQRGTGGYERIKADELVDNDRVLKRKYSNDNVSRMDSRNENDYHDHQVEWTSRKGDIIQLKRPSGYERSHYYAEVEQMPDGTYFHKDSINDDWTSYQDKSESIQEHSGKPYKMGNRHFKGYTKSESSKGYNHISHPHQRYTHYKQQNLRQRNDKGNNIAMHAQTADIIEYSGTPWKSDPSEDSDSFKQRIQAAFLDFSKRFNENPTARKLYKEEGKAGRLFCVVCRRSASKEFQNTKALATHAYMSYKVGLRPQHLGLHKAICFLMGWNTMPDPNSGTWVPELLPKPEALAQKEDLILWPPIVIVHNISLSNNDHNKWKLINIDALGEFLRVKGFHLGKMKICLGNPGDHSVILVKFLGTFSGLQEAERLHKIFLGRKHGRVDFEQAISGIEPVDELAQGDNPVEKVEDGLLYGYMGISEDLDSVDFDTKKRCSVKSKKEIHELADAPVKPE
ncbi:uncharacterized protein LOC110733838 [Chenopodium quinoa]|uniref:uncharacterized protein LOC110733838 n=1 Tax=Chenopodium quinoa TaxID=63459 RepID=UPI000B76EF06|nr:uncharacterized protein LOC110733838 [Chenopodium quinoa]XP_021769602.1 uncharacterized protein LOC110733838 [Chenopodium quinoa]